MCLDSPCSASLFVHDMRFMVYAPLLVLFLLPVVIGCHAPLVAWQWDGPSDSGKGWGHKRGFENPLKMRWFLNQGFFRRFSGIIRAFFMEVVPWKCVRKPWSKNQGLSRGASGLFQVERGIFKSLFCVPTLAILQVHAHSVWNVIALAVDAGGLKDLEGFTERCMRCTGKRIAHIPLGLFKIAHQDLIPVRYQEKGFSAHSKSSVMPKKTKDAQEYWTQKCIWRSEPRMY